MEQLTTYRAQGKEVGLVFLFKYDLNGNLKLFEIEESILDARQMKWLFSPNFPANESIMKSVWMIEPGYLEKFEIAVSPADLSFNALWELYAYKRDGKAAEKAYNKLSQADRIKCFVSIPQYDAWLKTKTIEKAYLSTYINKRRFDDDYAPPPKPGKNQNPTLKNLANSLTQKFNTK